MHPDIQRYLQEHRGKYPSETLRTKLLSAGYPLELVNEAFTEFEHLGSAGRRTGETSAGRLLTNSKIFDWLIGFFGPIFLAPLGPLALLVYVGALVYTWNRYPYLRRGMAVVGVVVAVVALSVIYLAFSVFVGSPFGFFR